MIPERGSLFLCDSSKIEEKQSDVRVQDKWRRSKPFSSLSFLKSQDTARLSGRRKSGGEKEQGSL